MLRPVYWQVGKPFTDRYRELGDWERLEDTSQQYKSSVTWLGGQNGKQADLVRVRWTALTSSVIAHCGRRAVTRLSRAR